MSEINITAADVGKVAVDNTGKHWPITRFEPDAKYPVKSDGIEETRTWRADGVFFCGPDDPSSICRLEEPPATDRTPATPSAINITAADVGRRVRLRDGSEAIISSLHQASQYPVTGDGDGVRWTWLCDGRHLRVSSPNPKDIVAFIDPPSATRDADAVFAAHSAAEFLRSLEPGECIVSSNDCSAIEIAYAQACGRLWVDGDGLGYVRRPKVEG